MIDKAEAEKIIEEFLDYDRLEKIIENTSVVAWNYVITADKMVKWLNNFSGQYFNNVKNERKLALWLLSHFSFFTNADIRTLCKNIFNQYLHIKLENIDVIDDMSQAINDIINDTVFVGLGNDSESGKNISYYFRQENHLSKRSFDNDKSRNQFENLVFIDDVSFSGEQVIDYLDGKNLKAKNIYIALLVATEDAIKNINESGLNIQPFTSMLLDERDKAFSPSSYVFSDKRVNKLRPVAKELCEYYGKIAVKGCGYMETYPLGFENGQYMIGFEHNIPDNTLPIFWGNGNNWYPLFQRYEKVYNKKRYKLDGRKYY